MLRKKKTRTAISMDSGTARSGRFVDLEPTDSTYVLGLRKLSFRIYAGDTPFHQIMMIFPSMSMCNGCNDGRFGKERHGWRRELKQLSMRSTTH